jgi:hypothetical protein
MARQKTKTHDVNEVANDPTDVFAEAAAAQASTPGTTEQTLQEALAATMPPAHTEHATHADHAAPHSNGHAAAQVVQSVADATAMPEEYKPKWIDRFAEYVDAEAGVKLRQDRKNGLSTIAFKQAPSEAVLDLLDSHGYQFDQEFGVFAKKVSDGVEREGNNHESPISLVLLKNSYQATGDVAPRSPLVALDMGHGIQSVSQEQGKMSRACVEQVNLLRLA